MPFALIRCRKTLGNALIGSIPIKTSYAIMGNFRAVFVNSLATFLMDFLHIVPEKLSAIAAIFLGRTIGLLVDAHLTQILQNDFMALDIFISSFLSAIFATSKAVSLSEFSITRQTFPENKSGCHQDLISKSSVDFCKVLDKIKSKIVA